MSKCNKHGPYWTSKFKPPISIHSDKLTRKKIQSIRLVFLQDWASMISHTNWWHPDEITTTHFLNNIINQNVWLN